MPFSNFYSSTSSPQVGIYCRQNNASSAKLYEEGLITYLRTDGISISNDVLGDLRDFIKSEYGDNYLSENTKIYKSKAANSQEAHEPIRPTDFSLNLLNQNLVAMK